MDKKFKLLIRNAKQVVQVCNNGETVLKKDAMKHVAVLNAKEEKGVDIIVDRSGCIVAYGHNLDLAEDLQNFDLVVDATNKCVLPGLIDGHTHPVWAGDRVHEFALKLAGATYEEIHKSGAGIHFTTEKTRQAPEDELLGLLKSRLEQMLRCGTTTVECKSGYGLDVETEIKMLKVLERAKRELPIEISSTFCGAHAVPKGKTADEATEDVINCQLPRVQELRKTGELEVENIDVFCEKGVFDTDQTRRILEAGVQGGLAINFHGDELHPMNSGELGGSLKARAISHLERVSDEGIEAMAEAGCIAVMLPTTAYILKLTPPPVRKMIQAGVPIALGTDFNPNAYCLSMFLTMHLACVILRMSMEEALVAATINAAASVGRGKTHGSVEEGKVADFVIADVPRWEHLIYQMGCHDKLVTHVIKNGEVVYHASR